MRVNPMFSEDRRRFLQLTAAGTLAALGGSFGEPLGQRVLAAPAAKSPATADTLIVLWMAGGMAHTETFDPKRHAPFVPGMKADEVLSTFPAIDTAVDNIKISAGLEKTAAVSP